MADKQDRMGSTPVKKVGKRRKEGNTAAAADVSDVIIVEEQEESNLSQLRQRTQSKMSLKGKTLGIRKGEKVEQVEMVRRTTKNPTNLKRQQSKDHQPTPSTSAASRSPERTPSGRPKGCKNWTYDELSQLLHGLLENKRYVRGKFVGASGGQEERKKAWQRILNKVNSVNINPRTMEQVRGKAKHYISETRADFQDLKKKIGQSGGPGGDPKEAMSDLQLLALEYGGEIEAAGIPRVPEIVDGSCSGQKHTFPAEIVEGSCSGKSQNLPSSESKVVDEYEDDDFHEGSGTDSETSPSISEPERWSDFDPSPDAPPNMNEGSSDLFVDKPGHGSPSDLASSEQASGGRATPPYDHDKDRSSSTDKELERLQEQVSEKLRQKEARKKEREELRRRAEEKRLEEERKRAEEKRRHEQRKREERQRIEAERLRKEEEERQRLAQEQEQERQDQERREQLQATDTTVSGGSVLCVSCLTQSMELMQRLVSVQEMQVDLQRTQANTSQQISQALTLMGLHGMKLGGSGISDATGETVEAAPSAAAPSERPNAAQFPLATNVDGHITSVVPNDSVLDVLDEEGQKFMSVKATDAVTSAAGDNPMDLSTPSSIRNIHRSASSTPKETSSKRKLYDDDADKESQGLVSVEPEMTLSQSDPSGKKENDASSQCDDSAAGTSKEEIVSEPYNFQFTVPNPLGVRSDSDEMSVAESTTSVGGTKRKKSRKGKVPSLKSSPMHLRTRVDKEKNHKD